MAEGGVIGFWRLRQLVLVGSIAGALFVAVFLVGPCAGRLDTDSVRAALKLPRASSEELYATATGMRHGKVPTRIEAAKTLAARPEAEPWIVLLFVSSQRAGTGSEAERKIQKDSHKFELGVVAVAFEHLPKDVGSSVLWAMTYLLNEAERGRWSEQPGFILTRESDHASPPIRELARRCLKDRLGVDHGWDASAWRVAITKRKVGGSVNEQSSPETETQPAKSENDKVSVNLLSHAR